MASTLEPNAKQEQDSIEGPACKQKPAHGYQDHNYKECHKTCGFFIDSDNWGAVEHSGWHSIDMFKWNEVIRQKEAGEATDVEATKLAKGAERPRVIKAETIEGQGLRVLELENCFICRVLEAFIDLAKKSEWLVFSGYCQWGEVLELCEEGCYAKPIPKERAELIWGKDAVNGEEASDTLGTAGATE